MLGSWVGDKIYGDAAKSGSGTASRPGGFSCYCSLTASPTLFRRWNAESWSWVIASPRAKWNHHWLSSWFGSMIFQHNYCDLRAVLLYSQTSVSSDVIDVSLNLQLRKSPLNNIFDRFTGVTREKYNVTCSNMLRWGNWSASSTNLGIWGPFWWSCQSCIRSPSVWAIIQSTPQSLTDLTWV